MATEYRVVSTGPLDERLRRPLARLLAQLLWSSPRWRRRTRATPDRPEPGREEVSDA
jgi:hypothetical protein